MEPRFEIDLRRTRLGGCEWRIFGFDGGRMSLLARGHAPFRWLARADAALYLRRRRYTLALQLLGV